MRFAGEGRIAPPLEELAEAVDPEIDHLRGPVDAPVTLVEYGDFECPYCGRAESVLRELARNIGNDLTFVFRHLPLVDVHERAQLAAEASEAAGAQDLLGDARHADGPPYGALREGCLPVCRRPWARHGGVR
ncbi:MAG: DsbA family protein [Actinomycetota bacterium]